MQLRLSRAVAMLALLTCLVCPLLEMFDRWDHTLQTGQDTEYALVLLALCLGAAYVLARFIFASTLPRFFSKLIANLHLYKPVLCANESLFVVSIDGGPPSVTLRI